MLRTLLCGCGLLLALPTPARATAQVADELIYQGKTYRLFTTPLESNPARKTPNSTSMSTACWRRYKARWEIAGGELRLVGLQECHDNKPIPIDQVLPGQKLPIAARWFSGVLRVPQGKQLAYVHMGFRSRYEKDLLISITAGKVTGQRVVDNRPGLRSKASKPPSAAELDKGLALVRGVLRRCGAAKGAPAAVKVELELTASGDPAAIRFLGKVRDDVAICVEAAIVVGAHFPVLDGEAVVQHRIKLR
jgi:hypothetical protein